MRSKQEEKSSKEENSQQNTTKCSFFSQTKPFTLSSLSLFGAVCSTVCSFAQCFMRFFWKINGAPELQ